MKVKVTAKGKQNRQTNENTQTAEKPAENPQTIENQPTAAPKPLALDFSSITGEEKAFLAKFLIAFAALFLIVIALPIAPLLEWIAQTEADWLYGAGIAAFADGAIVHAGGIEFEIVNECSSFVMVALLAALLIAGGKKSDWKALALGAPFLFAFNLLRLFGTMAIGAAYGESALDATHYFLWLVDAGLVLAVWIAFGRKRPTLLSEEKQNRQ